LVSHSVSSVKPTTTGSFSNQPGKTFHRVVSKSLKNTAISTTVPPKMVLPVSTLTWWSSVSEK